MPWKYDDEGKRVYERTKLSPDEIAEIRKRMISVGGGNKNYLKVVDRNVVLRKMFPEAKVITEVIYQDEKRAVFKATVICPDGTEGVGHGSETSGDFRDYLEKAESKAVGRALTAAGIGVQYDLDRGLDYEYEDAERVNPKDYTGVDTATVTAAPTKGTAAAAAPRRTTTGSAPSATPATGDLGEMDRATLLEVGNREKERIGTRLMVDKAKELDSGIKLMMDLDDEKLRTLVGWAREQPDKAPRRAGS